jgi:hypothetical protein
VKTTIQVFSCGHSLEQAVEAIRQFQEKGGWEIRDVIHYGTSYENRLIVVFEQDVDAQYEAVRSQILDLMEQK